MYFSKPIHLDLTSAGSKPGSLGGLVQSSVPVFKTLVKTLPFSHNRECVFLASWRIRRGSLELLVIKHLLGELEDLESNKGPTFLVIFRASRANIPVVRIIGLRNDVEG